MIDVSSRVVWVCVCVCVGDILVTKLTEMNFTPKISLDVWTRTTAQNYELCCECLCYVNRIRYVTTSRRQWSERL
jgi:hypothetical protein